MKTKTINLYNFNELSDKAKEKAIKDWYETEDYPMLDEDLTEFVKDLLSAAKVEFSDINVLYSLSCCQGDGLCFTGTIKNNGITAKLSHSARYYYANSVDIDYFDAEGESVDEDTDLKKIYLNICSKAEKQGYEILEYRMNNEEFAELCDSNDYTFLESGKMEND